MSITFFNLQELERKSSNSEEFLKILKCTKNKNPFKTKYNIPSILKGDSYLLDLNSVLDDRITDPLYKTQYIKLAALRNFLYYKFHKDATLDIGLYPDINLKNILKNPLLAIDKYKLKFKYEELKNGKIFQ